MGDMGDILREIKKEYKIRHKNNAIKNKELLDSCDIPFKNNGNCLLFREKNKPKCDYYIESNKWKLGNNKIYIGDAKSFLNWYKKQ